MPESMFDVNSAASSAGGLRTAQATLNDADFNHLRGVIRELTGISMGSGKRLLVQRRVSSRLKATNIGSFGEYIEYLKSADASELEAFTNAVTTNLTSFFRERHHFEFLEQTFFPELLERGQTGNRRLRIWSSGCSTGEEPYSIAMTLHGAFRELRQWDVKILATDLDSNVLAASKTGVYAEKNMENIDGGLLHRWFLRSTGEAGDELKVKPDLRNLITFNQLNLMNDWPMRGKFDLIFCRNVVIYFDKPTQRVLMDRYANILEEGGYLILGHSESLNNVSERFELIGKTIYRRIS